MIYSWYAADRVILIKKWKFCTYNLNNPDAIKIELLHAFSWWWWNHQYLHIGLFIKIHLITVLSFQVPLTIILLIKWNNLPEHYKHASNTLGIGRLQICMLALLFLMRLTVKTGSDKSVKRFLSVIWCSLFILPTSADHPDSYLKLQSTQSL